MNVQNTIIPKTSYISLSNHLIAFAFELQVIDLCLQVSQGTEITAWTTRAQQSVRIFDVEDVAVVPDCSSKTAAAQLGDLWMDGRLMAICLAVGHVNLIHTLESSEGFGTRDICRLFLVQVEEREAGLGVLESRVSFSVW